MANELSALLLLAGETADRVAITPAQSLEAAIAQRVFTVLGPVSGPVRWTHDRIAATAYGAVRGSVLLATALPASVLRRATAEARPLSATPAGRGVIGALNAITGDLLEAKGSELAIAMAVRAGGGDVPLRRDAVRGAFPAATPRLAVFVHGLAETEESWLRDARAGLEPAGPFGPRLLRDLRFTPVYVRYNSGLHVSENGRRLAWLLDDLTAAWPVPVREVALIGHSTGGLIARSAIHAAAQTRARWAGRVQNLVTLGTPHTGAPLEKAVHAVAWALRRLPEGRPLADVLDARSAGIRDLRFGYVVDEEWHGEDGRRLLHDARGHVPLMAGCRHTFIGATLTADPGHPFGRLFGDLLVRSESAAGRHRRRPLGTPDVVEVLGPLSHFDLLDHPAVYDRIHAALASGSRPPSRPRSRTVPVSRSRPRFGGARPPRAPAGEGVTGQRPASTRRAPPAAPTS